MMTSRTAVAEYLASHLENGRSEAVQNVAAFLAAHKKQHQARYLTTEVARLLAEKNYLYARIITARPLSEDAYDQIEVFLRSQTNCSELELELQVDPDVLGGMRVETPTSVMDATTQKWLDDFVRKASQ